MQWVVKAKVYDKLNLPRCLATTCQGELGRGDGGGGWSYDEIPWQYYPPLCAHPHADCRYCIVVSGSVSLSCRWIGSTGTAPLVT